MGLLFARRAADGAVGETLAQTAARLGFADLAAGLVTSPVALLALGVMAGSLVGFARPSIRWHRPARLPWLPKVVLGLAHAAAHAVAFLAVAWAATRALAPLLAAAGLPVVALFAVVSGAAGGVVMGAYLGLANLAPGHAHGNESFSSMRIEDHKNVVRLHIDRTGALHLYAIGVDRACRDWEADPDAEDPQAPWVRPKGPQPRARLVDGPVRIHPREVRGEG